MMGFSSSAALSATLWPPSELLCRAWVTTLLRPVSGPSSGYTELLASLDWPRALSRSCRVNMESKDWRQWSEIQEDEGHGDGIVQGGGGLGHGAPGAAVLDQPHLPLWGRHLLPGHRRQHGQTCTGRALHKRPTAEVNCDSFEVGEKAKPRYNGTWRGGLFHGKGVWREAGHTYKGGFLYGKVCEGWIICQTWAYFKHNKWPTSFLA